MSKTPDLASALLASMQQASALCDESLHVVKQHESLGMVQVYGRLVGQFLGHNYTNLLAVLWAQYPELEPEEMRQEYEEPIASLTPESQQAIRAFLEAAKPALALAQQFAAAAKPLPYGGLPEIEGSVTEIEGFLLTPRFRDAE